MFLKALKECNTTMTMLHLLHNSICATISFEIEEILYANKAGIRLVHAKAELDLSPKGINGAWTKLVATDLASNVTVTTLILNRNGLGDQGVDIANALAKNCVLTSIELNGNLIGCAGCSAMVTTLLQNTVLTKITLNGNRIGWPGAMALAEMLRINASLRELGLGRNNVGNAGAAAIADALKCNTTLLQLDLEGNNISIKVAILKALKSHNRTLTWLNLKGNADISPVLWTAIHNARVFNFQLFDKQFTQSIRANAHSISGTSASPGQLRPQETDAFSSSHLGDRGLHVLSCENGALFKGREVKGTRQRTVNS
jgi:Leucine Rich repeat